jgi:ABC-type glycerol-3-phosphate transport system permease component
MNKLVTAAKIAVLVVVIIAFDFPIINAVLTSLKSKLDVISSPPKWIFWPVLTHFENLFSAGGYDFPRFLTTSVLVSAGSSIAVIVLCLPAAYAIARRAPGGAIIVLSVTALRLVPPIVLAVPIFIVFGPLHLIDTRFGLILADTLVNIPLTLLLLISFVGDIPKEFDEAAAIDGASVLTTLRMVIFPLVLPGVMTATMLSFIISWNEFVYALVLTIDSATPVTVGATLFITAWGIRWGDISAAIVVSVIPTLLVTLLGQRYIVKGLTFGGVKN